VTPPHSCAIQAFTAVARCGLARHGTEKTPLRLLYMSVESDQSLCQNSTLSPYLQTLTYKQVYTNIVRIFMVCYV
jgi:hypothetical protein